MLGLLGPRMPQAAYQPLPASSAAAIGDIGSCAFVTAGPRSYLPAISCVSTRLKALGSRYPLLIFVQSEDESYMRTQLRDVRDGKVLAWNSFPTSASSRVHPARIMDKLNLLGAPIKRLVWIDADMYVRHNIDELCESCPKTSSLRRPSTQPVGVHRTCGPAGSPLGASRASTATMQARIARDTPSCGPVSCCSRIRSAHSYSTLGCSCSTL